MIQKFLQDIFSKNKCITYTHGCNILLFGSKWEEKYTDPFAWNLSGRVHKKLQLQLPLGGGRGSGLGRDLFTVPTSALGMYILLQKKKKNFFKEGMR